MFDDPQHACSRCTDGYPPENDGAFPLRLDDGTWHRGCVNDIVKPETWEMVSAYSDWDTGHTPVTTGRAPWLPSQYVDGMREVRESLSLERRKFEEKREQAAKARGRHGR